jgi:branched-chain amino acid transport system permease protein
MKDKAQASQASRASGGASRLDQSWAVPSRGGGRAGGLARRARMRSARLPRSARAASLLALIVLACSAPSWTSQYDVHVLTVILIFVPLVVGQNFITGNSGQVSMCHAAFYGLGAYVAGILAGEHGWPALAVVPVAVTAGAVIGLLVGLPAIRVSGDYLFIITIGANLVFLDVVTQWVSVTGGSTGIVDIPEPVLGPWQLQSFQDFYFLALCVAIVCAGVTAALQRSRFGTTIEAVRDDPIAASSCGISATPVRVSVFALAAAMASLSGVILAYFIGFVGPQDFSVDQSLLIFEAAVLGGLGSVAGSVVGAALLVGVPQLLLPLQSYAAGAGGLLVILVMVVRPQGVLGRVKVTNLIRK